MVNYPGYSIRLPSTVNQTRLGYSFFWSVITHNACIGDIPVCGHIWISFKVMKCMVLVTLTVPYSYANITMSFHIASNHKSHKSWSLMISLYLVSVLHLFCCTNPAYAYYLLSRNIFCFFVWNMSVFGICICLVAYPDVVLNDFKAYNILIFVVISTK